MKTYIFLSSFVFLAAQSLLFEGVAAVVGNAVILKSDVSQLVSITALQQKIDLNKNPETYSLLQAQAIESLIDQQVILEMAKLDSVEVKETDVDMALNNHIENIISRAGSQEIAEEYLGRSIKSFRRESWADMQGQLIIEQYQYSLLNKITINREGVVGFYEEYQDSLGFLPTLHRINHIQLSIGPSNESVSSALSKINKLRLKITSGESFRSLAVAHSEDAGTSPQGGDLGYVQRGTLVSEFESVAFTQDVGLVSEPILTKFGFHLIETIDRQGEKAKIRHILIKPEITASDEIRVFDFALTLKDSLLNFDTFKQFAKTYSDDKITKDIGGDLGWVDLSNFPIPEFALAVQTVSSISVCSSPIKTSAGYHLIWISDVRPGGKPNLLDHWPEVESMALNQKKLIWFKDWLKQAKSLLFISIYDGS